jgi:nitrogen regulatory protein PII-like uncharacterized protein
MKDFKEYYEDKEIEQLNEELTTVAIAAILGLPYALAMAYGGSWLTYRYARTTKGLVKRLVKTWKDFKGLFNKKEDEEKIDKTIDSISKDTKVQAAVREVDKMQKKFAEPLSKVNEAIQNKDIDKVEIEYNMLESKYKNNPQVRTAILDKIMEVYEEPPVYITSPGNDTYQAIKKILGIKTAQAMEQLAKESFTYYYDKVK